MKDTRDSKTRVAAHRARLRAAGLRPIEVWSLPEYHARIREFTREINRALIDSESSPDDPRLPLDTTKP
jgi:DNA-directed RNA polymerase subunit K/omega